MLDIILLVSTMLAGILTLVCIIAVVTTLKNKRDSKSNNIPIVVIKKIRGADQ